jgi:hypothetical protein
VVVVLAARPRDFPDPLPPSTVTTVAVIDAVPYILLGVVALQLIEAFFVLRHFRRKEAAPPTPGA